MSAASSNHAVDRSSRRSWQVGLSAICITIGVFFTAQIVAGLALGLFAGTQHWSSAQIDHWLATSIVAQFLFSLMAEGLLVVGVGLALRWFGWRMSDIGLIAPKLKQLFYGVLALVPYYGFYVVLVIVISAIVPSLNVSQKQELGFAPAHDPVALVLTFLGLVVIPALAEEITMRGFLYTGLKKWLPTIWAALVVSLLFGAAHLAEGGDAGPLWIGAIDTFSLSLVLVFLREKTGNLWAGIVLHALKNTVAFVSLFIISQ